MINFLKKILPVALCILVLAIALGPVYGASNVKHKTTIKKPSIKFTYVPKYGSFKNLRGKVLNVKPKNYRVAVYIYINGWWSKPYWSTPKTKISSNGNWVCDITTGGIDQKATKIRAYLIPANYNPPLVYGNSEIPLKVQKKALAWVEVKR